MHQANVQGAVIDSLGLTPVSAARLAHAAEDIAVVKHTSQPYGFRDMKKAQLQLMSAEFRDRPYVVMMNDISNGACTIMHGFYVYPYTDCQLTIETSDGERIAVSGTAITCEHLQGVAHIVGIIFSQEIAVEMLFEDEVIAREGVVFRADTSASGPSGDPYEQISSTLDQLEELLRTRARYAEFERSGLQLQRQIKNLNIS